MCAKSPQSCLMLCNCMDCNLLGSSVHGILQAKVLEWIATASSRGSSDPGIEPGPPRCRQMLYRQPAGQPRVRELHFILSAFVLSLSVLVLIRLHVLC